MDDHPAPGGDGLPIKIMSFNIRYGTADDGDQSWPHRRELVLERIRAFDPDLLGLQECRDDGQAAYLKARLQDYRILGIQRGGQGESAIEMAPALFKRSSFEAVDSGHFWLSSTPEIPGSTSWGSMFPRTVTWVTLRCKLSDPVLSRAHVITFLNTHFDYGGEATTQSACLLRRKIDRLAAAMPVILTGDFNADKDSPTYDTLLGELTPGTKLLYDTFRKAHPEGDEREGTCHDYGRRVILPAIDWILASDHFIITEARVDRSRKGSLFPSDHYPLLATARLRSHPVQGRWS